MWTPTRTAVLALVTCIVVGCGGSTGAVAGVTASAPLRSDAVSEATTLASAGSSALRPPLGTLVGTVPSGRILFEVERGDIGMLAIAYLDATGYHEIATEADTTLAHAVWSTSDDVVFDSERAGNRHVFRMSIVDGAVMQLTTIRLSGQERPSASSDGTRIVSDHYDPVSNQDFGLQIWTEPGVDPTPVTQVGDAAGKSGATQASFSPDDRSIAYVQMSDFDVELGAIFVIDLDGGLPRRLTDDLSHIAYPRWSPDGGSILFTQSTESSRGEGPLMIVDAAGGLPQPLFDPGPRNWAFEGDWSPDGRTIVYKYWNATLDNNQLWTVNSDGTDPKPLWVGGYGGAETPDWGP